MGIVIKNVLCKFPELAILALADELSRINRSIHLALKNRFEIDKWDFGIGLNVRQPVVNKRRGCLFFTDYLNTHLTEVDETVTNVVDKFFTFDEDL